MAGKKSSDQKQDIPAPADTVAISIRFPRELHEKLRKIAFDERVSINSLIMAGIGKALESRKS